MFGITQASNGRRNYICILKIRSLRNVGGYCENYFRKQEYAAMACQKCVVDPEMYYINTLLSSVLL